MPLKTGLNLRISGTEDASSQAKMSPTNLTNIEGPLLKPSAGLEVHSSNDSKVQEPRIQTPLKDFFNLKPGYLPIDHSRKLGTVLVSELVGCIDSKDPLATMKEEISTGFLYSSKCSEVIPSTSPVAPVSYGMKKKHLNPVVVLERLSLPTTCFDIMSVNVNSIERVEDPKSTETEMNGEHPLHLIRYKI